MGKLSKNIIILLLFFMLPVIYTGCAKNSSKNGKDKGKNTGTPYTSPGNGDISQKDIKGNETEDNNVVNNIKEAMPVEAGIEVTKIDGLSEGFICGTDVSDIKSEYENGVKYYDFEGRNLVYSPGEGEKGFFNFLKECGINWVRIRVWNSLYNEEDISYGGGNNNLETAMDIGKLATDAGLRVFIDFHYPDFQKGWTDSGKYQAQVKWQDMDIDEKLQAFETCTIENLTKLIDYGVDIGMVQIGNKTVDLLSGEEDCENILRIINEGSKAVHYVADTMEKEILVALHFTDIKETSYKDIAEKLKDGQADYDVFAVSYYPFLHGTTESLTNTMKTIAEEYGKKVMVAETSYIYTFKNNNGNKQSIGKKDNLPFLYDVSVQGQADAVADVIQAAVNMGEQGIGVFYAASYKPYNAVKWNGSPLWGNQALFNFKGHPLESACIFKYVFTGTVKK